MCHKHASTSCATRVRFNPRLQSAVVLIVAFVLLVTTTSCSGLGRGSTSPEARAATLRSIADGYAQTGDLDAAKAALNKLNLANPAQVLITLGEQDANEGQPAEDVQKVADLAGALGARSNRLVAYLAPTEEPPTPAPTETTAPTPPPAPSATQPPPTVAASPAVSATVAPGTAAPAEQAAGGKARVTARNTVNLRSGPGAVYPVVGQLAAGRTLNIMGRNASGDWWRVAYPSEEQAWVAGVVIDVAGPIDTVAVVKNIPARPVVVQAPEPAPQPVSAPVAAPAPAPTAAPAPAPNPSGLQFVIKSLRLRPLSEGQACGGGNHGVAVLVLDVAGNPLNNVRVRDVELAKTGASDAIQITGVSGMKGPGRVEYTFWKDGGGQVEIVDDAGNRIGELTRGMSNVWPDFDLLQAAGYCSCVSMDGPACQDALQNHTKLFAAGHYFYEVTYQRTS